MKKILMTSLPRQQERARSAGVDALLEKPLDLPLLLLTSRTALASREPVRFARRGSGALTAPSATEPLAQPALAA